ncbi:MAG: cytochrome C oxidase subunit IV family protein [Tepidisphaeraceae bacterium]|jgi:cytochrome c oxidase subunit 4
MSTPATQTSHADHGHGGVHPAGHVTSVRLLLTVYFTLVIFTIITYSVSRLDLGQFNIIAALAIAVIKASLVVLYFMHLRWDSPFNALALITAITFVALFIGLALLDSVSYQPLLKQTPAALGP